MGEDNPCERYVCTRQSCPVHNSRWVWKFFISIIFVNLLHLYSCSLVYAGYIALKQQYISHTNTNSLAIIPTYSGILSAIEKVLQDLIKEY